MILQLALKAPVYNKCVLIEYKHVVNYHFVSFLAFSHLKSVISMPLFEMFSLCRLIGRLLSITLENVAIIWRIHHFWLKAAKFKP